MLDESSYMKRHMRWRIFRAFMYLFLFVGGLIIAFGSSAVVDSYVGKVVSESWAVGLVLASAGCFAGSVTDRWLGEYGCLPFLYTILAFYSLSAIYSGFSDGTATSTARLAFGFIILAFSSGLIARWQDVRDVKFAAEESRNHDRSQE